MVRTMSSFRPRGMVSVSISVTKPYLYSLLARSSMVSVAVAMKKVPLGRQGKQAVPVSDHFYLRPNQSDIVYLPAGRLSSRIPWVVGKKKDGLSTGPSFDYRICPTVLRSDDNLAGHVRSMNRAVIVVGGLHGDCGNLPDRRRSAGTKDRNIVSRRRGGTWNLSVPGNTVVGVCLVDPFGGRIRSDCHRAGKGEGECAVTVYHRDLGGAAAGSAGGCSPCVRRGCTGVGGPRGRGGPGGAARGGSARGGRGPACCRCVC